MSLQLWTSFNNTHVNNGLDACKLTGGSFSTGGKIGLYCLSGGTVTGTCSNLAGKQQFSIAIWVYAVSSAVTGDWTGLFRLADGSSAIRFEICPKSSKWAYTINNTAYVVLASSLASGKNDKWWDSWHHMTMTCDGDTAILYMDGVETSRCGAKNSTALTGDFQVVNNDKVKKNDLRIYDHCLSPKEVADIAKGLVLHYPLNNIEYSPIIYDCSGYGNDGTVVGTLTTSSDTPRYDKCTVFDEGSILTFSLPSSNLLTVSFWIYRDSFVKNGTPLAIYSGSKNSTGFSIYSTGTGRSALGFRVYDGEKVNDNWYYYTDTDSGWKHFVLTHDGQASRIYENGALVSTLECSYVSYNKGLLGWSSNNISAGLSDFRIYNTNIDYDLQDNISKNVLDLYQTSAFITDNGTLEGYLFEEGEEVKIEKSGEVVSLELYEVSDYTTLSDPNIVRTYTPAKNAFNKGLALQKVIFPDTGQYIVEMDIEWTKFTADSGGDFKLLLQGSLHKVSTDTWVFETSNLITVALRDSFDLKNAALNDAGTHHYKNIINITDISTYDGYFVGVRCDYSDGTGLFTMKNLKVYPFLQGLFTEQCKLGDNYITASQLIEL